MSSLKTTTLQPESGHVYVDGALSVASNTSVGSDLIVGRNFRVGGLLTVYGNVRADAPISCGTTPTLDTHLANKSYVDSVLYRAGRLVFFGVYPGEPDGFKASITLPAGTFKMKVEALYTIYMASFDNFVTPTVTLSSTWGSSATVSNTRTHNMNNSTGTCGGYFNDSAIIGETSASFPLEDSTTADFSASITMTYTAAGNGFADQPVVSWYKVHFYSA